MSDKDYIKDLFSEKLGNYEAKVNPELWSKVASQIGAAGTTAASTGISLVAKWIIGVSIATVATVTTILVINATSEETARTPEEPVLEAQVQTPDETAETTTAPTISTDNTVDSETANEATDQSPFDPSKDASTNGTDGNSTNGRGVGTNEAPTNNEGTPSNSNSNPGNSTASNPPNENTPPPAVGEPDIVDPMADQVEFIEEFEPETKQEAKVHYTIDKLPNIITPNGDGVNEVLTVASTGLTGFKVVILNDKNQIVYQSNDPNFRWDGTDLSGQPVEAGNYIYVITANEFEAEKPKRFSPLRVIR